MLTPASFTVSPSTTLGVWPNASAIVTRVSLIIAVLASLGVDRALLERAVCSLTHSHDGNSKAFRERAIAAFFTRIGQANGFALSFGQLWPTNRLAELGAFSFGSNHAGNDALADHSALKFGEDAEHLKHGFA